MKKYTIALLFLFAFTLAFSQEDTTTVFSIPGYNKDPLRSKWTQKVVEKDSLWIVSLYDKKNVLQEEISYADKKLEVRKGPYKFYDNGILKEEGNYRRGYKVWNWNYYYAGGEIFEQVNYLWGKFNGTYKSFWNNGNLKKAGTYAIGKKVGNWKMYYKDKQLALNEEYDESGKLKDGIYFDQNGNSVTSLAIIQPPSFPGGMKAFYEFLGKEIKYPAAPFKNGVQGTVRLAFMVTKFGKIQDITVIESPDEDLSREAIKVLQYSPNWTPAKELGEVVNMKYAVPIKFTLR